MQNYIQDSSVRCSFICRCIVGFISVNLAVTDQLLSDILHSSNMVDSVSVTCTQTSTKHKRQVLVTYSRVCMGKISPVENDLGQGDALWPLPLYLH